MPSYRKIRIEPNTGTLETDDFSSQGTPENVNTPILPPQPTTFKPFKKSIILEGTENISYIVVSSTGLLNSERQLIAGSGIQIVDNGPNSTVEIRLDPTFSQTLVNFFVNDSFVFSSNSVNFKTTGNLLISAVYVSSQNRVDYTLSLDLSGINTGSVELENLASGSTILAISGNNNLIQKALINSGTVEVIETSTTISFSASPQGVQFVALSGKNGINVTGSPITYSGEVVLGLVPTGVSAGFHNFVQVDTFGRIVSAFSVPYLQNITLSSRGTTGAVFVELSGSNHLIQKRIIGGGNIVIENTTNEIKISSVPISVAVSAIVSGEKIITEVSSGEFKQRTLDAGTGIILSADNNRIIISFDYSLIPLLIIDDVGTSGAVLLSAPLIGEDYVIEMKRIVGGGGIEVSSTPNYVIISSKAVMEVQVSVPFISGKNIVADVSSNEIYMKLIDNGPGITIVDLGNALEIGIDPSNPADFPPVTVSSLGTSGVVLFSVDSITGHEILLKNIVGGGGIEVSSNSNYLIISATPQSSNNWIQANNGNNFANSPVAGANNSIAIGDNAKATVSAAIAFGINAVASANNAIAIGHNIKISADNSTVIGSNGNKAIFINAIGNVGIGTENPQAKLHIESNEQASLVFQNSVTGSAATDGTSLELLSASTDFSINNRSGDKIIFSTNNVEKFIVNDKKIIQKYGDISQQNDAIYFASILKAEVSANASGQRVYFTFPDGSELFVPDNTAWMFDVRVLAKQRNQPQAAGYKFDGLILKMSGNATIQMVNPPMETIIAESTSAFAWQAGVSADSTTGNMRIYAFISGVTATEEVDWLAFVNITQITN